MTATPGSLSTKAPPRSLTARPWVAAALALGVMLAAAAAFLFHGTQPPPGAGPGTPAAVQPAPDAAPAPIRAAAAPMPAVLAPDPQAGAALQGLVLFGTFAQQDPAAGYALIGHDRQSASLYGAGADVAPGLQLHGVYTDRVVLSRGDALLVLPIATARGGAAPATPLQVAAPPPAAGDMVRAAAEQEGRMPGIRVFPGRNRGAFARLGLHPGDLVTAVNGQPVGPADAPDLQQLMKDAGTATVTVFRAGRLQQVTARAPDESEDADDSDDPP